MGHFSHLQPTPLNPKIVAVMLQKHHSQLFCVGHISTRIDVPSRSSPSYAIWLHSFCMSLCIDGFAHISVDYEVSSCVCVRERERETLHAFSRKCPSFELCLANRGNAFKSYKHVSVLQLRFRCLDSRANRFAKHFSAKTLGLVCKGPTPHGRIFWWHL